MKEKLPKMGIVEAALFRRKQTIQRQIDKLNDQLAERAGIEAELHERTKQLSDLNAALDAAKGN